MATKTGKGFLRGSIKNRTQVQNPKSKDYMKRDRSSGQFMSGKPTPYKNVAQEPDRRRP